MKKLLLIIALLITMAAPAYAAIDLSTWNVTLPVDAKGTNKGEAVELSATGHVVFHIEGSDTSLTFKAPVDGAHTKGTKYPRDELRELSGKNLAAWKLSTGGTMPACLQVDAVPKMKDGSPGKEVIGQIHGKKNELVRLYYNGNGSTVYFHNDRSGEDSKEHEFLLKDAAGKTPVIPLRKPFCYDIDAHKDALTVKVMVDGDTYSSVTKILPLWQKDSLYFKAGVYLGNNAKQGATGYGQTTFQALTFSHP
jgi:hypothetical protein